MTKNLTVGNPALLIVSFAAPLFIGNLFQQFYSMADAFIVGRTIGVQALAAVGCTGSISFFILGFVWGFTQGAAIVTSQRFGAGDEAGVRRSFAAGIILCTGMTVLLTAISVATARYFLVLMRTPQEILDAAYAYIIIIYWGIAASVMFNLLSNMMRAVGDSRTPLFILVAACIVNIILDFVFILIFHTGVEGAAYATIIAQVTASLLCLPVINTKLRVLRLTKADWRVSGGSYAGSSRSEITEHLKMAFPMGFQLSIIAIGTIGVQFALNGLGTTAVAAFTAAGKIDQVATMPMAAFGAAMTTFAAQNYGARKFDRIRTGIFQSLTMSGVISLVLGVAVFLAGHYLAALFIGSEPEVIALAHTYLQINGACYLILSILFICRQSLQGLGDSVTPTVAGIMELVMRLFGAILLAKYFGFVGVCWASPLAWLGAAVPLFISVVLSMKRLNRQGIASKRTYTASGVKT